jgi:hypothetical protein
MKIKILIAVILLPVFAIAQSDLEKVLKAAEIITGGISIFKLTAGSTKKDSKLIETLCVKNKLTDKITINITGKTDQGDDIKKQLVIQKDGKECFLQLLKGIYTYEVLLANNDIYKKGEYKFDDDAVITVKKEE